MHIVLAIDRKIPVFSYGGTERVIWYLGQELVQMGHKVTFLATEGSTCPFATMIIRQKELPLEKQLPVDADVIHFNYFPEGEIPKPYVVTLHGNKNDQVPLDPNTIFVSSQHASRFGSNAFVYNGMNWNDYGKPDFRSARGAYHFLGNAAWRVKNVRGAISAILRTPSEKMDVLGGSRLNIKMGFRFTISPRIRFHGMVGGEQKLNLLKHSRALVFPVLWHEPFGLAITESMYFGAPVFGTPYGSLPELVSAEVGTLTTRSEELTDAILASADFSAGRCHQRAADLFNARQMAAKYLMYYEQVLNGKTINTSAPQLREVQTEKFLPWS
jgi:hypothetical protein